MAAPSDNSFIPKRGPAKQKRKVVTRQVYIFTYISYILIFATLLAAGGVFLYGQYVNQQLNSEIAALNSEISSFDQARMEEIVAFDNRLQQAEGRLNNTVSVASIFTALEAATIDTVEIESLTLDREADESYALAASVITDSFDSTIFQRDIYESNPTFPTASVRNVRTRLDQGGEAATPSPVVTFDAELQVPLDRVPYQPSGAPTPTPVPSPATPTATTAPAAAAGTSSLETTNEPTS